MKIICLSILILFSSPYSIQAKTIKAYITGYNTVKKQTDSKPCISSSGYNICRRRNVVACPRWIKFGTKVKIRGNFYYCYDRLGRKSKHHFDINCDKDYKCPRKVTGWTKVIIY